MNPFEMIFSARTSKSFCTFQLLTTCVLYRQIKKEYGSNVVPAFPPKKIFTLTPAEVEQRREQLEKYMQAGRFFMPDGLFTVISNCSESIPTGGIFF